MFRNQKNKDTEKKNYIGNKLILTWAFYSISTPKSNSSEMHTRNIWILLLMFTLTLFTDKWSKGYTVPNRLSDRVLNRLSDIKK